jgi:phage gp46-like protein
MDIALIPDKTSEADIAITNNDLMIVDGFDTAVYISLFTDARDTDSDDANPSGGYWGDGLDSSTIAVSPLGSLLWKYARAVITSDVINSIKTTCSNALKWMIDDGIAGSIAVTSKETGNNAYEFGISISKPGNTGASYLYRINWDAQAGKISFAGAS